MLFGCSPCCVGCGCKDCKAGTLPESVTLTIDGFEDGVTPGRFICPLEFSACYGSGAEARVTAPGGNADTDKGPISAVQVLEGGSGYAKIGRVAPTVTVSGVSGSGSGATFAVTLASSKDACNVDRWAVSKVVRTGGAGYANGDTLTFAVADGDTQEVAATAKISDAIYAEPTLSLSVPGGTGAVLQVDGYTKSSDTWGWNDFSDTWRISGITVANGGTGYTNNTLVTVNLGQGDQARPGAGSDLRVRTAIVEPTGEWTLEAYDEWYNPSGGSGLELSFTLTRLPSNVNPIGWEVTAATVTSGGSGYAVGEIVDAYLASSSSAAALEITSVDQNGAVTGISVVNGGQHEGTDSGVIESVENLFSQAGWRKAVDNPDGVVVTNGGVYYREDESAPAYVSPVTVTVTQSLPSAGSGASLSAEIDDDPESETFGQITGVNIDNGGDGYLAYEWCESVLQGLTVVLPRREVYVGGQDQSCFDYYKEDCGRSFRVDYLGPCLPPRVILTSPCYNESLIFENQYVPALFDLSATENISNCSELSFTATDSIGRSVTVTPGGVPTEASCSSCAGHVLVNGVQVPLAVFGNGNYTLVSVDQGPTISTQLVSVTIGTQPTIAPIPNWWRTYAVAQANTFSCSDWGRGQGPQIRVRVGVWVFGLYNNGPSPPSGYVAGDYDQLTVGSVRANNPFFADWNFHFSQTFAGLDYSPAAIEDRLLGPIRGNNCTGNEWEWDGGYDVWDGTNLLQVFFAPGSPRPPSLLLGFKNTRQTGRGNVQCGPI